MNSRSVQSTTDKVNICMILFYYLLILLAFESSFFFYDSQKRVFISVQFIVVFVVFQLLYGKPKADHKCRHNSVRYNPKRFLRVDINLLEES